jgi:glycosyltransferase involved in cell wall biosynthesis
LSEHRARIEPVAGAPRPRWSVMIPTYNCARYVGTTLESVLEQDEGPGVMQIEVVDDCSSDDVADVVSRVGGDRVAFHRQPRNVGHVANFATCLARSRGQLVHLLHGDDAVRPGFYRALGEPLARDGGLGAAFCRYVAMDSDGAVTTEAPLEQDAAGVLDGWLERIATGQRLQTPAMVVRRSVYERLGGFDARLRHCEDWEMWTRIAAHYPVWYDPSPLALYRVHTSSSSAGDLRTGANVRDLRLAIEINRAVLPPGRADELSARALRETATTAIRRGARGLYAGDRELARNQAREAFRTDRSPVVAAHAAAALGRYALSRAVRAARRAVSPADRRRSSSR